MLTNWRAAVVSVGELMCDPMCDPIGGAAA